MSIDIIIMVRRFSTFKMIDIYVFAVCQNKVQLCIQTVLSTGHESVVACAGEYKQGYLRCYYNYQYYTIVILT